MIVKIDVSDTAKDFQLSIQQVRDLKTVVLNSLVSNFVTNWEQKVRTELKSSRRQYLNAIYVNQLSESTAVVGLNPKSKLARMIEGGASSFDMKIGFAKSGKIKYNKKGEWYINIPFRHATPDAVGESELFSSKIPREIYNISKRNQGSPVTFEQLPKEFQKLKSNPTTGYVHKAPIFQGLVRKEVGATPAEKRGQYMTFRRVSQKSDPDSWIHKGIKAHNFLKRTLDEIDIPTLVNNVTNNFLTNL